MESHNFFSFFHFVDISLAELRKKMATNTVILSQSCYIYGVEEIPP
jgi:hypothetical protein